jgi:photosystem II stability/assembly factor-like uncharacterized protein
LAPAYIDVLDLPAQPSALAPASPLRAWPGGQRLVAVGERGHILYSDDKASTGSRPRCRSAPTSMP